MKSFGSASMIYDYTDPGEPCTARSPKIFPLTTVPNQVRKVSKVRRDRGLGAGPPGDRPASSIPSLDVSMCQSIVFVEHPGKQEVSSPFAISDVLVVPIMGFR